MKVSLNKLIEKYYDKINYLGTTYGKNNKQYIQVGNVDFAEALVFHYDNIKLIRAKSVYAQEIKKAFITLK